MGPSGSASGVTCAADHEIRRSVQFVAGQVAPVVQPLHDLHDLDGIQIVHRLGVFVIADGRIVPGETENVSNAQQYARP